MLDEAFIPSRVARNLWAGILLPLVARALQRGRSIPDRMLSLRIARSVLDELVSSEWMSRIGVEAARRVEEYMRSLGYRVAKAPDSPRKLSAWVRENMRCFEEERTLECLDRMAEFAARLAAVAAWLYPVVSGGGDLGPSLTEEEARRIYGF